jgi:hypothetical protein
MRKFEGNINGKKYTDEKEFNKVLLDLDGKEDMYVSYQYISVPDEKDEIKLLDANVCCNNECDNYVYESDYIKNISNKSDIELDSNLINKLKNASNKSAIELNVCKKISDFDNKISDNLLRINDLKSDYKKLDEKIKLINSQIKTLDNANNNYYLQKEYYTNIKDLFVVPVDVNESKESGCTCDCGECKCNDKKEIPSLKDIYDMTPQELAKYIKKNNIYNLADLVNFFIKNC